MPNKPKIIILNVDNHLPDVVKTPYNDFKTLAKLVGNQFAKITGISEKYAQAKSNDVSSSSNMTTDNEFNNDVSSVISAGIRVEKQDKKDTFVEDSSVMNRSAQIEREPQSNSVLSTNQPSLQKDGIKDKVDNLSVTQGEENTPQQQASVEHVTSKDASTNVDIVHDENVASVSDVLPKVVTALENIKQETVASNPVISDCLPHTESIKSAHHQPDTLVQQNNDNQSVLAANNAEKTIGDNVSFAEQPAVIVTTDLGQDKQQSQEDKKPSKFGWVGKSWGWVKDKVSGHKDKTGQSTVSTNHDVAESDIADYYDAQCFYKAEQKEETNSVADEQVVIESVDDNNGAQRKVVLSVENPVVTECCTLPIAIQSQDNSTSETTVNNNVAEEPVVNASAAQQATDEQKKSSELVLPPLQSDDSTVIINDEKSQDTQDIKELLESSEFNWLVPASLVTAGIVAYKAYGYMKKRMMSNRQLMAYACAQLSEKDIETILGRIVELVDLDITCQDILDSYVLGTKQALTVEQIEETIDRLEQIASSKQRCKILAVLLKYFDMAPEQKIALAKLLRQTL